MKQPEQPSIRMESSDERSGLGQTGSIRRERHAAAYLFPHAYSTIFPHIDQLCLFC